MNRLRSALCGGLVLTVVAVGALIPMRGEISAAPAQQRGVRADIYMSAVTDGMRARNFVGATNQLHAVVEYENAAGEQFDVQLRDLSGIVVKRSRTAPLRGDGKTSVAIVVQDFVDSYAAGLDSLVHAPASSGVGSGGLDETIASTVFNCENRPDVPVPWPPAVPTPNPGSPPPTQSPPDPYTLWLKSTLTLVDSGRLTMAEITRTSQALLGLPDMQGAGAAAAADLAAANALYSQVSKQLARVPALLQPPDGAVQPDPDAGCALVTMASQQAQQASTRIDAALAALPDDVSNWTLPDTSARYDGQRFVACEQYSTELYLVVNNQPSDTPADSALWTLGDPGEPALIFAGPEQTDSTSIGTLALSYPDGATQIFARSVLVEGVNHSARVGAFVTDRNCRPVSGGRINFRMDPDGFGTLSSASEPIVDGIAQVTFMAGDDVPEQTNLPAPQRGRIQVLGQVGEGPSEVNAGTEFNVTGPAATFRIIVSPKVINPLEGDRGGITVEVRDRNGNKVADGTQVMLRVKEGSRGQLAYEQRRGAGPWELVVAGTEIELIARSGNTVLPVDPDPGVTRRQAVYLIPFGGDGPVTLIAEADGATGDSDALEGGQTRPTLFIQSYAEIYLPGVLKDAKSLPRPSPNQPHPTPSPRPTQTPYPTLTPRP